MLVNWERLVQCLKMLKWKFWEKHKDIIWRNEVAQSCPTLCDPIDCSPPGSSVHGIFQARMLEWVAISFSRGTSQPRDRTWVSCIVGRRFTVWATREAPKTLYITSQRKVLVWYFQRNNQKPFTGLVKSFIQMRACKCWRLYQSKLDEAAPW